jgi:hypothetical protein
MKHNIWIYFEGATTATIFTLETGSKKITYG